MKLLPVLSPRVLPPFPYFKLQFLYSHIMLSSGATRQGIKSIKLGILVYYVLCC